MIEKVELVDQTNGWGLGFIPGTSAWGRLFDENFVMITSSLSHLNRDLPGPHLCLAQQLLELGERRPLLAEAIGWVVVLGKYNGPVFPDGTKLRITVVVRETSLNTNIRLRFDPQQEQAPVARALALFGVLRQSRWREFLHLHGAVIRRRGLELRRPW